MTQPWSEIPTNRIPINVSAISDNFDEKNQINKRTKTAEVKKKFELREDKMIKLKRNQESGDSVKNQVTNNGSSLLGNDYSFQNDFNACHANTFYQRGKSLDEVVLCQDEEKIKSEPLFFIEVDNVKIKIKEDSSGYVNSKTQKQNEKPKRYSRSSLKKQKIQYSDDCYVEPCKNTAMVERENADKTLREPILENDSNRKSRVIKTEEIKRKTFLRKVSLQDAHLNYNQDYWLDLRKSGRFHQSIDLGYFGDERVEEVKEIVATPKKTESSIEERQIQELSCPEAVACKVHKGNEKPRSMTMRGFETLVKGATMDTLSRCDSDPLVFTSVRSSCKSSNLINLKNSGTESSELLLEIISGCETKDLKSRKGSWFLLPSNENIPLFSERNGLIETDFDVLNDTSDEKCLVFGKSKAIENDLAKQNGNGNASTESSEAGKNGYSIFFDFSNFCEIQLTSSNNDSDNENVRRSSAFGLSEDLKLISISNESDAFYETEPKIAFERKEQKSDFSVSACSSSPPKSTSD